jgi:hypothetical protein
VARFYKPIDHAVLLEQCKRMGVSQVSQSIVSQYLPRPENKKTRKQENKKTSQGMIAGGCLSPLLAALMLTPLDQAMGAAGRSGGIGYIRDMDDFIVWT